MSKTAFVLGPEKALEIINRMPEYDAVFVLPDGRMLYSNGLRPPDPRLLGRALPGLEERVHLGLGCQPVVGLLPR
jgi:hypothetical protein